jgi:hypothetical protein
MALGDGFFVKERGSGWLGHTSAFGLRMLIAAAAAALVIGMASAGLLFSTAPERISLIFEPMSLMLMPGLLFGIYEAGPHDLNPKVILWASGVFYFLFFLVVLEWWARSRQRRRG